MQMNFEHRYRPIGRLGAQTGVHKIVQHFSLCTGSRITLASLTPESGHSTSYLSCLCLQLQYISQVLPAAMLRRVLQQEVLTRYAFHCRLLERTYNCRTVGRTRFLAFGPFLRRISERTLVFSSCSCICMCSMHGIGRAATAGQ